MNWRPVRSLSVVLVVGVITLAGIVFVLFLPRRHHTPFPTWRNSRPPPSLFSNPKAYIKDRFSPPRAWNVQISGTTGTPIVVGYELDLGRAVVLRATVPTNFAVHGRHIFYFAVKNAGNENA